MISQRVCKTFQICLPTKCCTFYYVLKHCLSNICCLLPAENVFDSCQRHCRTKLRLSSSRNICDVFKPENSLGKEITTVMANEVGSFGQGFSIRTTVCTVDPIVMPISFCGTIANQTVMKSSALAKLGIPTKDKGNNIEITGPWTTVDVNS